jgi:predicted outer membrane repeat protein
LSTNNIPCNCSVAQKVGGIFIHAYMEQCDIQALNTGKDATGYKSTCVYFRRSADSRRILATQEDDHFKGHKTQRLLQECVKTCVDLRKRKTLCGASASQWPPCLVTLCKNTRITCPRRKRAIGYDPIDLTDTIIVFECEGGRCEIDGDGDNQLFNGTNVTVQFKGIDFINSVGGAIRITHNQIRSKLDFLNCSFVNNSASSSGSAIAVRNTELLIDGSSTRFINNQGNRPPLEIISSKVVIRNAKFKGNNITEFGSGALAFASDINCVGVLFIKTRADTDCDIFVAVYENKLTQNASCLKSDTLVEDRQSDLAECPVPIPTPTLCFFWLEYN